MLASCPFTELPHGLKDLRWALKLRDVLQIMFLTGKPFVDCEPLSFQNKPFPHDKGDTW